MTRHVCGDSLNLLCFGAGHPIVFIVAFKGALCIVGARDEVPTGAKGKEREGSIVGSPFHRDDGILTIESPAVGLH